MTKREIMLQVLSEIFDKPKEDVSLLCDRIIEFKNVPDANVPMSNDRALKALKEMREDKDGIFAWIVQNKLIKSFHPDEPII